MLVNLNSISAQISLLRGLLTDYYVAITLSLQNVIARLMAIANSLTSISNQLSTQQNILFFIIDLINNLGRKRRLDDNQYLNEEALTSSNNIDSTKLSDSKYLIDMRLTIQFL